MRTETSTFKPLFGIFNQPKYIPLQWMPLNVEFEVVANAEYAIASTLKKIFPTNTTSRDWQIQDCQTNADVIELDSAVHKEYASHLMQGHPIPINYTSLITQLQAVANGDVAVNITRSCSRVQFVFTNFDKSLAQKSASSRSLIKKSWNAFCHSMGMAYDGGYNHLLEAHMEMLVGNKTFAVFPMRSRAEQYYQLKKSPGIHGSSFRSISIDTSSRHISDHYSVGIDTDKVLGASFSGQLQARPNNNTCKRIECIFTSRTHTRPKTMLSYNQIVLLVSEKVVFLELHEQPYKKFKLAKLSIYHRVYKDNGKHECSIKSY